MGQDERTVVVQDAAEFLQPSTRRRFLRALGLGGSIMLLPGAFAACTDTQSTTGLVPGGASRDLIGGGGVNLDLSNDVGIFNYAFAIEQVAAAFYTQVVTASNFNTLFTSADERELLTDIRRNEVTHREFLRAALGTAAIPNLTPNFAGVNFGDRFSVLSTAAMLEDLDVAAYNGAGPYIRNANNLLMSGKIVSVEARQAAALRDVLDQTGRAFADLTTLTRLGADTRSARDAALPPSQVIPLAQPFVSDPLNLVTLPS